MTIKSRYVLIGILLCAPAIAVEISVTDVRIEESGSDDPNVQSCGKFITTNDEATAFFKKASLITSEERQMAFSHYPCWIKGSAKVNGIPATWKIRAGGTAHIQYDGKYIKVADEP